MTAKKKKWLHVELPVTDYVEAWKLQQDLAAAETHREIGSDIVLSLEHYPVFTLGRRGRRENMKVTDKFLKQAGVSVIQVERGGDITFHGPGQIVVYPIINLDRFRLAIGDYMTLLEDVILQTAAGWNVWAGRNKLNRGAWVGNSKLGSIGIAVRRGITMHGLALNVNLDLEPFGWINPCGLQGITATSMKQELSRELPIARVRKDLMRNLALNFGIELVPAELSELQGKFEVSGTSVSQDSETGTACF